MPRDIVTATSYARAGLLGNPSDGYQGKTIAISVRNFEASVQMEAADEIEIVPSDADLGRGAASLTEWAEQVNRLGFHGGIRLIKASILKFYLYSLDRHSLSNQNFRIRYQTNIPRSVGLAGSSAIITATLKALTTFFELAIPREHLASLAWSVEKDLLNIPAGLMDRVIQMLEGVVFMDFSPKAVRTEAGLTIGDYQSLPAESLESMGLYLGWADSAAEPTEVLHNRLKERYESGDPDVVEAMQQFASLAEQGRAAIEANDRDRLGKLIDANFDLRASICQLPGLHRDMVARARQVGASAKFCGSGGAILGICRDDSTFRALETSLNRIGCRVIRPRISE